MPAAKTPIQRKAICWLDTQQADLLCKVAKLANLKINGAGSPTRAQTGAVATEVGTEAIDDLRVALTEGDADVILIFALGEFGRTDAASDAAALLAARARGVKVLTLEPFPGSAIDLASRGWLDVGQGVRPVEVARLVPLPRRTPAFRESQEIITNLGEIRSVAIEALAHPADGSLAARLVAALDTVCLLMGEPETIDAAFCSLHTTAGLHALPGETLANLHGDMSLNVRFSGGRSAAILASDQAGAWSFHCTAIGPGGRLRLHDNGFEWFAPSGEKADETSHRKGVKPVTAAHVIADAVSRALDPHLPESSPIDWPAILSMTQAALLSARTGQGESPATFRAMLGQAMAM